MADQDVQNEVSELSAEELAAELEKIERARQKQREYMAQPEVKAKMREANKKRYERRKAILERARKEGLTD